MENVYILGGAQTDFERNWKKEGKNMVALLKEVVTDGLYAAGLDFDDVRTLNKENRIACFVGNFIINSFGRDCCRCSHYHGGYGSVVGNSPERYRIQQ